LHTHPRHAYISAEPAFHHICLFKNVQHLPGANQVTAYGVLAAHILGWWLTVDGLCAQAAEERVAHSSQAESSRVQELEAKVAELQVRTGGA
jgi:hypothetical protein